MLPSDDRLRAYALLPADAARATVAEHLAGAERDVIRMSGRASAPTGLDAEWEEAVLVTAQRRLWPVLYPLDDSFAARDRGWQRRQDALIEALRAKVTGAAGGIDMEAI